MSFVLETSAMGTGMGTWEVGQKVMVENVIFVVNLLSVRRMCESVLCEGGLIGLSEEEFFDGEIM